MADIRINALATTAASTASDDFIAVDGSANGTRKLNAFSPTFGGNLTVSGTGTSSIGGNTKIGNPANANQRLVVDGAVAGVGVITTNTGLSGGYLYSDGGTGGVVAAWNGGNYSALSIFGTTVTIGTGASGTTAATITSTGNLLVGTTTNYGSGRLQLIESNIATDGIGFGSDISLYRQSTSNLALNHIGGSNPVLNFRENAVQKAYIGTSSSVLYVGTNTSNSVVLQTNTLTALTLDSSQNATFAGQITASGISHKLGAGGTGSANALLTIDGSSASNYGSYIVLQRNSTNKWLFGTYSGIQGGASDDFVLLNSGLSNEALKIAAATSDATFAGLVKTKLAFEAYDGATADRWQFYTYTDKTFRWNYNGSGSDELSMDTSGNLIVAGSMRTGTPAGGTASAWKFGKYNTTAPSATGYVEVDIGGTLYKLLAST